MNRRGVGCADRGSATIYLLAWTSVLMAATVAAVLLAGVFGMRQRADTAADLAAVAAATARTDPCGRARVVAVANGARLVSCRFRHGAAEVVAEVTGPGMLQRLPAARTAARAGPVSSLR